MQDRAEGREEQRVNGTHAEPLAAATLVAAREVEATELPAALHADASWSTAP
jgi:hypothetical protein